MRSLKKYLLVAALFSSSAVIAAESSVSFTLNAVLNASCLISANNINFGSINAASPSPISATGSITTLCSRQTSAVIEVNKGTGFTVLNRSMGGTNGNADRLNYNLYTSSNYTDIVGNQVMGSRLFVNGTGLFQVTTIYARMPPNQYVKADNYTDTLTVTMTY